MHATRRAFLRQTAAGAAGLVVLANARSARTAEANEKLNLALVGVGGRGRWFVDTLPKMENLVALCDVDDRAFGEAYRRLEDLAKKFETSEHSWERRAAEFYTRMLANKPQMFHDFRRMLDAMGKGIDAVVIAVPDHTHAVISAAAIKAGKPVFCEKPLTRTVGESRILRQLAREHKVATSMGNQGTASGPFRRSLELIRDGTIGEVKEVHIWNTGGGADRTKPPEGSPPVPDYFKWDLWLGPAAERPYHPQWTKRNLWRDFGTCQLGNWASHTANLAFMALKVHTLWTDHPAARAPKGVIRCEAASSGINRLSFPKWEVVRWHIPPRAEFGPITFTWYNRPQEAHRARLLDIMGEPKGKEFPFAGALIVGTKGTIHSTGHNATFTLVPAEKFQGIETQRPQQVDASRGHERDWLIACRGGKPAWANFEYAVPLNEFLMLGNVATQIEGAFTFHPLACRIVDNEEADGLLRPRYRDGWSL
jgi:predicted dehydrogenase